MSSFAQELVAAVSDQADRPAVRLDDRTLSYRSFEELVALAAGVLRSSGVRFDDRVGMQLPNLLAFPIVYQAVLRLGAIAVPMNPLLKSAEVAYHLRDSGARLMVAWSGVQAHARAGCAEAGAECLLVDAEFEGRLAGAAAVSDVVDRSARDPAVIIYTSGTTGAPKGGRADS